MQNQHAEKHETPTLTQLSHALQMRIGMALAVDLAVVQAEIFHAVAAHLVRRLPFLEELRANIAWR